MSEKIKKAIEDAEVQFFMSADSEAIHQVLQESTDNMGQYISKRDAALTKIKFLATAAIKKQRDTDLLKIASGFRDAIEKNIKKPVEFLRSLMSNKVAAAFNSSLDKLSQEEIVELIKDQNLVNLLDQLEQDGAHNES